MVFDLKPFVWSRLGGEKKQQQQIIVEIRMLCYQKSFDLKKNQLDQQLWLKFADIFADDFAFNNQ